jgi:hypothetical protein
MVIADGALEAVYRSHRLAFLSMVFYILFKVCVTCAGLNELTGASIRCPKRGLRRRGPRGCRGTWD